MKNKINSEYHKERNLEMYNKLGLLEGAIFKCVLTRKKALPPEEEKEAHPNVGTTSESSATVSNQQTSVSNKSKTQEKAIFHVSEMNTEDHLLLKSTYSKKFFYLFLFYFLFSLLISGFWGVSIGKQLLLLYHSVFSFVKGNQNENVNTIWYFFIYMVLGYLFWLIIFWLQLVFNIIKEKK